MKKNNGFTIVEAMLFVLLISILAAIVIPRISIHTVERARLQECVMSR